MTDCDECISLSSRCIYATKAHRTCPACSGTPPRKLQRPHVRVAPDRARNAALATSRSHSVSPFRRTAVVA